MQRQAEALANLYVMNCLSSSSWDAWKNTAGNAGRYQHCCHERRDRNRTAVSAAVERLFGISRNQQIRGTTLARLHASQETTAIFLTRQPRSYGPKAKLDLGFVWNWFHNSCDLITVDKSQKGYYSRRSFCCAGKLRHLECQRRIIAGYKKDCVKSFKDSETYRSWPPPVPLFKNKDLILKHTLCTTLLLFFAWASVNFPVDEAALSSSLRSSSWITSRTSSQLAPVLVLVLSLAKRDTELSVSLRLHGNMAACLPATRSNCQVGGTLRSCKIKNNFKSHTC